MPRLDRFTVHPRAIPTRPVDHTLLHKQRQRAVLFTEQIRARDIQVRGGRGRLNRRCQRDGAQSRGPVLAFFLGEVVEEEAYRV